MLITCVRIASFQAYQICMVVKGGAEFGINNLKSSIRLS